MRPTHLHILQLPTELIDRTLYHLDLKSLLTCRQVCKKLKTLIDTIQRLQYKIKLEIVGMYHNDNPEWTTAECYKALDSYYDAWRHLKLKKVQEIPRAMSNSGRYLMELNGGIFVTVDGAKFNFYRLRAISRLVEAEQWTIDSEQDVPIQDITMDPSQNLFIWITVTPKSWNAHFYTLNEGYYHPLAANNVIQCVRDAPIPTRWFFTLKIMEDYFGVLSISMKDTAVYLSVWNWKTGALILDIKTPGADDFTFISNKHLLLSLFIISEDEESSDAFFTIIDFQEEEGQNNRTLDDVRHSMTLVYPERKDACLLSPLKIYSEPSPGWAACENNRHPFRLAENNRMLAVHIKVDGHDECEFGYLHLIPISVFLDCISRFNLYEEKVSLPWSTWASKGTRLLQCPSLTASLQGSYSSHGSRYVGLDVRRDEEAVLAASIYDCNQLAIRWEEWKSQTGENPSDIPPFLEDPTNSPFAEDVSTSLPFLYCTQTLPIPPRTDQTVLCTADNIIVLDDIDSLYHVFSL